MVQSFTLYYLCLMDVLLKSVQNNLNMGPFFKTIGIDVASFYHFDIWFWNFSNSVVFVCFSFYINRSLVFVVFVCFSFYINRSLVFVVFFVFHFITTVPLSLQGAHLYILFRIYTT